MDYSFVIASRIAKKIQTIYHQCSKHSYYHSIQKRSFWKNVHITKRSENINSPIIPNLWYTSAEPLFLSITLPGIDCEVESIWPGILLPSNDPKLQPLNNGIAFPSNSCPVVRNLQSPWKNVYLPKFYDKMFSVKFLTRDKSDRSRDSWSSWSINWEELSNIPSDDILSVKVERLFNRNNKCRWIEYDLPTSKEGLNRYGKKQWI